MSTVSSGSADDATGPFQVVGQARIHTHVSGAATNASVASTFDRVIARTTGTQRNKMTYRARVFASFRALSRLVLRTESASAGEQLRSWTRKMVLPVVAAMIGATLPVLFLSAAPAHADTTPDPGVPATASAKQLPTWQINGVGWAQVVVGNTVYVTGSFNTARPPGVGIGGAGEVSAGNIFAYDIRTGNRIASFSHTLNAQGRGLAASPDGTRVYVVGDFTTVDGTARGHIAAFDVATGNLITTFAPNVNGVLRAVTATNSVVYYGGSFSSVDGTRRGSLAAANANNGSLRSWAPGADATVWALVLTPDQTKVVIGGQFLQLNAVNVYGQGAVSALTGASADWAANAIIHDYKNGAIDSLSTDGTYIYGSGFAFGDGGVFEGAFAANPDGTIHWLNDCQGDSYGASAIGNVVYVVGHPHNCTMINGFPDTNPRVRWQNSLALTRDATQVNLGPDVYGWDYHGQPAPSLLHWYPQWTNGTATGQNQATWAITGNSQYVVVSGEFPRVNGLAQQGLTRFGIGSAGLSTAAPIYDTKPARAVPSTTAGTVRAGVVRVAFGSAWDPDNELLSYQVVRDGTTNIGPALTRKTNFWTLPSLAVNDTSVPPGNHTYRVKISDPSGNMLMSPVSNSIAAANTIGAYGDTVVGDTPLDYWRLGEAGGNIGLDGGSAGLDVSTGSSFAFGAAGAVSGNTAATTDGTVTGIASTTTAQVSPDAFATEAWFKTTSTSGGKIIGFGNLTTGNSNSYDRHVFMTNDGKLTFGVFTGSTSTVGSTDSYNDGQWHQVVASMGPEGMRLYVDGLLVGKRTDVISGVPYNGYWTVGGDSLGGWPNQPTSNFFQGSIDEVAVYGAPLTLAQVRAHYTASGRTVNIPPPPSDSYGSAVYASAPDSFWRLNELSGAVARDVMGNTNGNLTGGATPGASGAVSTQPGDASVALDGVTGNVTAASQVNNPTVYSEELWFNTTTTAGGKLIGLGDQPTGNSGSYDRHVWMLNNGHLRFGTYTGQLNVAESTASYNDGVWHHLVATQGPAGMGLYVDGKLVGSNPQTGAQAYSGYWRVGGDVTWGDASSNWFAGRIDEVAIYSRALPLSEIQSHFAADGGVIQNVPPTASFTVAANGLTISPDASASTDPDGSIASYAWDYGDGTTGTGVKPIHTYATAGTRTVTLTVTDNRGAFTSATKPVTTVVPPADAYGAAVYSSNPDFYWRLSEAGGPTAADAMGRTTGTAFGPGITYGVAGAIAGNTADQFDGSVSGIATSTSLAGPSTYSEELWFNTTTTLGGKLMGFGDSPNGTSTNYDRHIYMLASGQIDFGVYTSQAMIIGSSASYNDGKWHHMVATQGGDGMKLYLDGVLVASGAETQAQAYTGYWRVGGDSSWAGSNFFTGRIDEVALYSTELTAQSVQTHYVKGGGQLPNTPPTASFTSTLSGRTVTTDAAASSDADGTVVGYAWDFGDGSVASGPQAVHTYTSAGSHVITLTVTDDRGATGTVTQTVVVGNASPVASFTSSVVKLAVNFDATGSKDPDGTVASYAWLFGDGTTGTGVKPSHTYAAAGSYTVTLTVTDNDGASAGASSSVAPVANIAPVAAFTAAVSKHMVSLDASSSSDADGTLASYAWDFGDGTTGAGNVTSHTYTAAGSFVITLTVTDNDGATGSANRTVVSSDNQPPVAVFSTSVNKLVVSVDATGSSDPDGTIASYAWDFGDGATAAGITATHTYAAAGPFIVTLTVTDNDGATGQVTHTVTVVANQAPSAAFTQTAANLVVGFDGSSSADPDGSIASYAWTFGDGTTGTGIKPSHTYGAPGTFQVTLVVTDNQGATGSTTTSVTVTGPFAADVFARTVVGGLGAADTGGAWTLSGASSLFSVGNGWGNLQMSGAGKGSAAALAAVSSTDTDLALRFTFDKAATGGGMYGYFSARGTFSNGYRTKVLVSSTGAMTVALTKLVAGTETQLASAPLTGVTFGPGVSYSLRMQSWGTSPTRLLAKVWPSDAAEPAAWTVTVNDATAALQVAGGIVVSSYASGTSTNTPTTLRVGQLVARKTGNMP